MIFCEKVEEYEVKEALHLLFNEVLNRLNSGRYLFFNKKTGKDNYEYILFQDGRNYAFSISNSYIEVYQKKGLVPYSYFFLNTKKEIFSFPPAVPVKNFGFEKATELEVSETLKKRFKFERINEYLKVMGKMTGLRPDAVLKKIENPDYIFSENDFFDINILKYKRFEYIPYSYFYKHSELFYDDTADREYPDYFIRTDVLKTFL